MAFFHSNFLLQSQNGNQSLPPIPPQDLQGMTSLMGKRSSSSFFQEMCDGHHQINGGDCPDDELSDDGSQMGEKKRRLNMEQVKTLEKNFELGNKLEPERKMQLARALGLQPRQIAIWFQNRRARWKTKQLEKDYDVLKRQFDVVKAENEKLLAQNQKLHAEIMAVKNGEPTESINLNKETEGSSSNRSENTSEIIKLDITSCGPARPTNCHHLLFPSSSNSNSYHNQSSNSKLEQSGGVVKEENQLCNMFVGIDDQTGFWPWIEHQQFN